MHYNIFRNAMLFLDGIVSEIIKLKYVKILKRNVFMNLCASNSFMYIFSQNIKIFILRVILKITVLP